MALKLPKIPNFKKLSQRGSTTKQDPYIVSLDIGTEFVKALIGEVKGDHVEIIGAAKQHQRLTDMAGGAVTDIAGVVDNCDKALRMAEKMAGVVARNTVIGIAGELVRGMSTTVSYRRARPEVQIDMVELKDIIERVQRTAFDKVRDQLSWETGSSDMQVKLVNAAVVDVTIDGYRVTNPIGFQGQDVSIAVFTAFAPMVHLGALQSVARDLDLNLINIAAEPFAVAKSVGADDSTEFSAIFIDIGGGTSDIAVVNNGGVVGTKMFAIGGRSFTKRIAQSLSVSHEEAEKLKLEHSAGTLIKSEESAVAEALETDVEVWLSGVELSLSEFDELDHLPNRILLCGGGSGLPEIKKALQTEWYKDLPFARKPKIDFVAPADVNRVLDHTGRLTSPQDITTMGLANLALDIVGSEPKGEQLLQRLSRTLSI
ncbi:rod shape-determining protein [bacterium]|jgi:cell division protein FtsA|nr:MAG: rod shape-determining protein [bacterium]